VHCSTVQYSTLQYSTLQYSAAHHSRARHSAVQCSEFEPRLGAPGWVVEGHSCTARPSNKRRSSFPPFVSCSFKNSGLNVNEEKDCNGT